MGAPITSATCNLTCDTAATDLIHLLGSAANPTTTGSVKVQAVTINGNAPEEDGTGVVDSSYIMVGGLRDMSYDFTAVYPKLSGGAGTTPRMGNTSLLTISGVTLLRVSGWTIDLDWGEDDITGEVAAATGWREYQPLNALGPKWRGSINCRVDSAAAAILATVVNSSGVSTEFKLTEDGANDPTLTGNILLRGPTFTTDRRAQQVIATYPFVGSGALTPAAGSNFPALLPASALDGSDWDLDGNGAADVEVVYKSATGRTFTSYGFLRSLRLASSINSLLRVDGSIRCTGAVTAV